MVPLKIQIKDDLPVCDQLIQAVRKSIFSGQLKNGADFPSVRELSRELGISCATVHKAVAALKSSGHLASRPGIGMVATTPKLPPCNERLEQLQPLCTGLINEAADVQLKFSDVMEALYRTHEAAALHKKSPDYPQPQSVGLKMPQPTAKRSISVDWISNKDRSPGSAQIVQDARKAMLTGRFQPGDKFPSVRNLSGRLGISTNTVHKAVAALQRSGHLASRRGIGLIVQCSRQPSQDERLEHLQPFCIELLKKAGDLNLEFRQVVEALDHSLKSRQFDSWKAHQSEWESIAIKLLARWQAHGNYYVHQNEFPQMDCPIIVHIDPGNKLKVVEFGPVANLLWRQGGFLFIEAANQEAMNIVQKHSQGLSQLNLHWFEYEECSLVF